MTTQVSEQNLLVRSVNSADGTPISYRTTGTGPGLIIVPGALALATDFDRLAAALAARFTVHTIERRGRGASGPQGDDLQLRRRVHGHRSGARGNRGTLRLRAQLRRLPGPGSRTQRLGL